MSELKCANDGFGSWCCLYRGMTLTPVPVRTRMEFLMDFAEAIAGDVSINFGRGRWSRGRGVPE